MDSAVRLKDGQFDFSGGVDSGRVPTIASPLTPNGLARNQVAWASNATMRGGGIMPRPGWKKLCRVSASALYQVGWLYDASTTDQSADPYLILSIGGRIYQVRVDTDNSVVDLSTVSGLTNPATEPLGYMCQGEEFLVIQAGDYVTLPLFWDGSILRRSLGFQAPSWVQGSTFTSVAIGGTVDITLPGTTTWASTGLPDNSVFQMDGFNYMHLLYTQRFNLKIFNAADAPAGFTFPFTLPAGTVLEANTSTGFITLLTDVTLTAFNTNVFGYGTPKTAPYYIYKPTADPTTWVWLTHTVGPLAAPVNAQHIWAVNLNDSRPAGIATTVLAIHSELPAAGPMDYYMGRLWYAEDRHYTAGDIVFGSTGTNPYSFRDSILKVTENPLAVGGDGFSVPSNAGSITALNHPANIDTATGEGKLHVFTQNTVYSLSVPVTRTNWIAADLDTMPLQTLIQRTNGADSDRAIVPVNGDLFYRSADGIRSLITATRDFTQWGNTPVSENERRVFKFEDRTLMQYASGIAFDNRLLQSCMPVQTDVGVAFRGLLPLDFNLISSLQEKLPPAWEGVWEGLKILQVFTGEFTGERRSFAVVVSDVDGGIDVWELTDADKTDEADKRIEWAIELPAYTWGKEFDLKELDGGELFFDRIFGCVNVDVYYRPDADPCWYKWHQIEVCAAQTSCETVEDPVCYPEQGYSEGFLFPITLPKPPYPACQKMNKRPVSQGYQFQTKLVIKGHARLRGVILFALPLGHAPYAGLRG